ncbi:MAG: hypothetical protein R6W89_00520 [Candidatus Hydrogenedentota bacterium]
MMQPIFAIDWVDAGPSVDRLSEATMANLEINLNGAPLISVLNRRTRSHRQALTVPLLPLAEWVVSNWWFLWHEMEDLQNEPRPGFEARHNFAHASDGFVYPNISATPIGEEVLLRVKPCRLTHSPLEFIGHGEHYIPGFVFEAELRDFVETVIQRLWDWNLSDSRLEADWNAVNKLDSEEQVFCQAAAMLGVDPWEAGDELSDAIVKVWNNSDPMLREDMLASADAETLDSVVNWVSKTEHKTPEGGGPKWDELRQHTLATNKAQRPWERGYELARAVRQAMGNPRGRLGLDSSGPWAIGYETEDEVPRRVEGLVAAKAPSCLIRQKGEAGQRFLLARAAGDYLSRPNGSASLLTSLSSPRQRQSRAFAAELLVPKEELKERIGSSSAVGEAAIADWAEEYGVSSYVVHHQIKNHGLAAVMETD